MLKLTIALSFIAMTSFALANSVEGNWRTESNDEGAYLVVNISPCESDNSKTCGTITEA